MARKRNVDAYGKSWSPVDIPNLEKAVELYKRLNELNDHFANSLSGSNKIWAQINERAELQEALSKTGIKITQQQSEEVLKLLKNQQSLNKEVNKTNHSQSYINYATNRQSNINLNNIGSSYFQNKMETEAAKYLGNAARAAGRKYTKGSAEYNNYIDTYMTTGRGGKELAKSANKFSLAADVIQVGANTFKEAVSTFSRLFFGGMNNQANSYNNNFTNISVRTGLSKSQYFSGQSAINSTLSSRGLYNNISNSEVTEMWNKLASNGLNSEDMMANALDTVITNKIVPFLDTSTAYFQQLADQQPGLMKQIRGIGLATQEINGSSVFANKYLQDMVDSLSPMASLAENQLGVQYAQMTGAYESLRAQGLSDATIGEMYKGSAALFNDPRAALKSDNLDLKLAAAQGIANGIDFRDASQVNAQYMRSANYVANLTPEGYMSPLYAGITNTYMSTIGKTELNERNLDIEEALRKGTLVANSLDDYANIATNRLASDYNQTAKTLQEVQLENMSTWLAKIYEQIGYWGNVLGVLVKGIAGIIGARAGSKLLGSLIKGKSGGTSLGRTIARNIASNGGLGATTGLGAAGTAVAGAAGIAGGIYGISEGIGDINRGSTARGVGSTVAGGAAVAGGAMLAGGVAASALGIGVANAWNPVGWVLMAAGLIGVAGTAVARAMDTTVDLSQELEAEKKNAVNQIKAKNDETLDTMYEVREAMKQSTSYEEAKQIALQSGIVSQEELNKATDKSVDSLLKLADVSIEKQKDMNMISEQTVAAYEDIKNGIKEKAGNDILDLVNTGKMGGRSYDDLSDDEKKKLNSFMQEYIKANKNSDNKDIKWRIEQWGGAFDDDILSKDDFNKIFNGNNGTTSDLFEAWVASDSGAKALSSNKNLEGYYGGYYGTMSSDTVSNYILSALNASNADKAKSYLKVLKDYGLVWDKLPESARTELVNKFSDDIKSYRTGLNSVPYDNYLANLHEGEAVLTASTANELRGLITEYRESQNQGAIIEVAISNQTTILVEKMSEIIQTIQSVNTSSTNTSNWSSTVRTSMKNMISTKSF